MQKGRNMLEATMGSLITYNPKAVLSDTTLEELDAIMDQMQVRHLPVVDDQHRVVGIVSERDLAQAKYNAALSADSGRGWWSTASASSKSWPGR